MSKLHEQVANDLRKKIENGTYPENSLIPKELDLVKEYEVSRTTIRTAIQTLVNEGYLHRKKKAGTKVISNKIDQSFTHIIESYNDEMKRKGLDPSTQVISQMVVSADEEVAEALEIPDQALVIKLIRLRFSNEMPVVLVTTYIPYEGNEALEHVDFTSQSFYHTLKEMDKEITQIKRHLEITKATETEAALLNVAPEDPLYYFKSVARLEDNTAIEYSKSKYRGDINSFSFVIRV
ncbi:MULTISPECIES: GntR family transcriptional regulator [Aerococcus]|uniref:GntR family transcriptional regulator n=1 Tax=Aerococcus sanguinicola TaxID=119206 RepID=A0A5N1GLB2_9LACT|nr:MULTISPECIES: GntR family transcriptional regulator [Aerococcus]KAA9301773.1 GntR family transcriptional regulator [Aerococcus sanguinicola]MDK6368810.1 GntR family transcriptional regulator [Aerococcus sp. UMB9870]MDK6679409.1 GntR family transcriptional regulator [Aerococcus sp. UMB8608]MDK6685747.1 GntR family transcriptional regulator [Aerococcus sp. UMB8623]MDK6939434.1 GntR family transcriptional regulator [Aerococcus sp. UMB8487]